MASAGAVLIGSNLPDEDCQNNEVSQSNGNSQNLGVGHVPEKRRQLGLKTGVISKLRLW